MGWLIFFILIGALAWGVSSTMNNAKALSDLRNSFMATHRGWEVYITPNDHKVLAIDGVSKRIALGNPQSPLELPWSKISSVEIERNGQSLTHTNRGSQAMGAAVGAVLLGPAGLLLGGLTGSKRSVEYVNDLSLKILVDHSAAPIHRIQFFAVQGKGIKPDSSLLKPLVEHLERFHALVSNAIRSEEHFRHISATTPAQPALPYESRIAQLWELKQSGALTDEEFASAKSRLLSDSSKDLAS